MRPPDLIVTIRRPTGTVQVYRFAADQVAIGEGPSCDVRLPDAGGRTCVRRRPDGRLEVGGDGASGRLLEGGLRLGAYRVDVALDDLSGPTSDELDTERRARAIRADIEARGWGRPPGAGAGEPASPLARTEAGEHASPQADVAPAARPAGASGAPPWTPLEYGAAAVIVLSLLATALTLATA